MIVLKVKLSQLNDLRNIKIAYFTIVLFYVRPMDLYNEKLVVQCYTDSKLRTHLHIFKIKWKKYVSIIFSKFNI